MFDKLKEIRTRKKEGLYDLTLLIGEEDFLNKYKSVDDATAEMVIEKFLINREDMGRPENINIYHDREKGLVNLTTELNYRGGIY